MFEYRSKVDVPLSELHEYFKDLNFSDDNEIDHDNNFIEVNVNVADRILSSHISAWVIEEMVRKLPSGKAAGIDCIKNEYIKNIIRLMLPVYEKSFNIILNTGIVPDAWTVGIIHPIYKNKSDAKDHSNYRPISLARCFSGVVIIIINNRLASYADEVQLISESHSGFRNIHSTTYTIFVLHSLVKLYITKKKRLFCTFADFSKAFDQVNRSFLWVKMLKSNISGKCFNMIKNMYQNIQSCVHKDPRYSDFVACNMGVRKE